MHRKDANASTTLESIRTIIAHLQAGRLPQADALCQSILQEQAQHPQALQLSGIVAYQQGKYQRAVTWLERAIKINPALPELYIQCAESYRALQQYEQAIGCYERALEINPKAAETHYKLGQSLQQLGQHQQAAEHYEQVLAIKPDAASACNNLGVALSELGRADDAIARFKQAITLEPEFAEAHNNLGKLFGLQGQHMEALRCHRRAFSLDRNKASYRAFFAASLEKIVFNSVDANIWKDLHDLLGHPQIAPLSIVNAVNSALRLHTQFAETLRQVTASNWDPHSYRHAASTLASIPLLLRFMALSCFPDLEIERMFTRLRHALLVKLDTLQDLEDEKNLCFAASLALHCFTNEYIFTESEAETAAIEGLARQLSELAISKQVLPSMSLLTLAAYRPLHLFDWSVDLGKQQWPDPVELVITRQVREPQEELVLREQIPALTTVHDTISRAVRSQYEENPYPRWINAELAVESKDIRAVLESAPLRLPLGDYVSPAKPQILIAGCGTGQHALAVAARFANAEILALDLSRSSLAYASRKTREYGFSNIEYAQADIMELSVLDRQFDLIESAGVLHHLADPLAGWRILVGLLRPGGLMKIGLYSELARQNVVQARAIISEKNFTTDARGIRQCREAIIKLAEKKNAHMQSLITRSDFFSLSECRDFLFHVHEQRFTLPQLESALAQLDLGFLGFEMKNQEVMREFKTHYAHKTTQSLLSSWHEYESKHPDTFLGMYQFWVRKN